MKVLLFSTATNNIGETYTLGEFAKELIKYGHECRFISTYLGKQFLMSMGFDEEYIWFFQKAVSKKDIQNNYSKFIKYLIKFTCDFALVSDWLDYDYNTGFVYNHGYSLSWLPKYVKIGTLDHFGYATNGIKTQYYKEGIAYDIEYPKVSNLFSFVIKPCPNHNNVFRKQDQNYFWGLNKHEPIIYENELHHHQPIKILFPIGFWQEKLINKSCYLNNVKIDYYQDIFIPILIEVLSEFRYIFKVYVVARELSLCKTYKLNNVEIIYLPPQSYSCFNNYMESCQILLTDNYMSSNIGKSLHRNIIPIVLHNSFAGECLIGKLEFANNVKLKLIKLISHKLIYPFLAFPIGFNSLPEITKTDNLFKLCFITAELFDKSYLIKIFSEILEGKFFLPQLNMAKLCYLNNNKTLLTAPEILKDLINK